MDTYGEIIRQDNENEDSVLGENLVAIEKDLSFVAIFVATTPAQVMHCECMLEMPIQMKLLSALFVASQGWTECDLRATNLNLNVQQDSNVEQHSIKNTHTISKKECLKNLLFSILQFVMILLN